MKLRPSLFVLALLAAVPVANAQLNQFKDWEKSPEFSYLATDDEKKAWKTVTSDADAEKFVNLFWAKRDPDLKTQPNEFKLRFDSLKELADKSFGGKSLKGSLTERGKFLILLGPPKSVQRSAAPGSGEGSPMDQGELFKFIYEELPPWTGEKKIEILFRKEGGGDSDVLVSPKAAKTIAQKAPAAYVKNPDLKTPPVYKTKEQIEKEMLAAQEAAAEAARGPQLSPQIREIVEPLFAKEPFGQLSLLSLAFRDGALNLIVQVHTPVSSLASTEGAKLVLLVKNKEGKDAARVEQPAVFQKHLANYFTDKAMPVTPGEYGVAAAILDSTGKAAYTAFRKVNVSALPTEFAASAVLLAYADIPWETGKPDDPYVFSQRKFLSKGEGKFEKTDGLSYLIRIYNPGVDPVSHKTNLKRSIKIKPKNGPGQDVPLPPDEPSVVPTAKEGEVIVVDMAGSIVDNNLGDYFKPGDLEFRLKVVDAVLNKTIEANLPFTIVGPPPGSAPPPAPKKK
ncbi:MAG: GWxTD domain-containing protein [Thermoanaerobaculia bacterium]|nr:GWxTD domain-containing protein [Thermoanaerobaculia bacterium]